MATVTIFNSAGGIKEGPGDSIAVDFGGASIPAGSTIDGITVNVNIAANTSTVGEVIVNVIDTQNGGSVTTVDRTSSTFPFTVAPTYSIETFGGSSDLFGVSTFTPSSFAGGGIRVVITNNTSDTLFYVGDGTDSNIVVTFTAPVAALYDTTVNNILLHSGNINISSGNISI